MKLDGILSIESLLDSSFPRTRESRFGLRPISLDTRFRECDGIPLTSSFCQTIALHVLSQESAKNTKVAQDDNSELRARRSFVEIVNPEEPGD
jgi:hypothetical protein